MRRSESRWRQRGRNRVRASAWITAVALILTDPAALLAGANATDPAAASAAEESQRRIILSIPDRKLALLEGRRILKIYTVAVGAPVSPSPTGKFRVINRVVKPAYYHEGKVVKPGKQNPLGSRWMGFNKKSYGIHGTNDPSSIGKAASHGCIRMGKHDVEELFELVRVGDTVEIHGRRTPEIEKVFGEQQQREDEPAAASSAADPAYASVVVAAMSNQFWLVPDADWSKP